MKALTTLGRASVYGRHHEVRAFAARVNVISGALCHL